MVYIHFIITVFTAQYVFHISIINKHGQNRLNVAQVIN